MPAYTVLTDIGSAVVAGVSIVNNPGPGGLLNLYGMSLFYCALPAGTYKLPNVVRPGIEGLVYATGNVILTNEDGTPVTSLTSGSGAKVFAKTATSWAMGGGDLSAMPLNDAGNYTTTTTVEDAIQELYSANVIEFPLGSFTESDGTVLTKWASQPASTPGFHALASGLQTIRWNNAATPTGIAACSGLPARLIANDTPVVHILASKTGATLADAVTFAITATIADSANLNSAATNIGGTTTAMVGNAAANTIQHVTLALTSIDAALATFNGPAALGLTITPTAGKQTTDDLLLHRVWVA